MAPYFVTFTLSSICCMLGEHCERRGSRRRASIFFFGAVLFVSVLAGVRDLEIGTDIWTYGEWTFRAARYRFTSDSHWLYFFTGLITYYFVMLGIRNYEKHISVTLAWVTFLFLYYGDTLNAMRQFISVAIAFWGLKFAFDGKYKKYLVSTIVAMLFHYTAFFSFLICAIILFLKRKDTVLRRVSVVLGISALMLAYGRLLELFINVGLIPEKYSRYYSTGLALSLNPVFLRLPFLIIIALFYKKYCYGERNAIQKFDSASEADVIIMVLVVDALISAMRGTVTTLYRAAFQFGIYRTIGYSRVCTVLKRNNRLTFSLLLLIYLIVVWVYQNVMQGNNDIYPFTHRICIL